jgi:hypothetical protein
MRELKSKVKRVFEGHKAASAQFPKGGNPLKLRSLSPCTSTSS